MASSADNRPLRGSARPMRYKFSCSVGESPTSSERQATYGVQFVWRPCKDYMKGGGSFWKGRGILNPDRNPLFADDNPGDALVIDEDSDEDSDEENESGEDDDRMEQNGHSHNNDNVGNDEADGDEINQADPDHEIVRHPPSSSRNLNESWRDLFATVNGNAVRVYEAKHRHKPRLLQRYEDDDVTEQFYCVGWTFNVYGDHQWWLCAAGCKGVLRIINVHKGELHQSLVGHGEAINDLKVHPRDPALVLTASKDESLRLWNLRTGVVVVVFAGLKGHRGEVVFADFNRSGSKFASCGIDNSIRIWDIYDDDKVVRAIKESHHIADLGVKDAYVYKDKTGTRRKASVAMSQFPIFVTRKVHKHYVDCVMWVGDLLISKSVHNRMFLWEPEPDRESLASPACNYTLLEEYVLDVCNVWFIRFAMDRSRRYVACGNDKGMVSVFDLRNVKSSKALCTVHPNNKSQYNSQFVRQCAFSEDGSILLAVDDNASVVQYELENPIRRVK